NKLANLIYTCWIDAGSPNPTSNIYTIHNPIQDFVLHQNYPNPFNSQTSISFELKKQAEISITIFNLKGQMVTEIFDGIKEPGYYDMIWDAGNVRTGMYIIKMEGGDFIRTKKCLILK
ncbi:MAG: T9SS type A sorting domain-containing protein, partial [bacterium]